MKFSTKFMFAQRKGIVEKIKELVNPADSLDMNVELVYEVSAEELKELYREYRSEVDASTSDVSNFLSQIGQIWNALKNGVHDLLDEIVSSEDKIYDVQNCILRVRKNAYENKVEMSKFRRRTDKEAAEEEEKTEE